MQNKVTCKVGKKGVITIPAKIRKSIGLEVGERVVIEVMDDGIMIRRANLQTLEKYTPRRKAEFLLSNAVNKKDFTSAVKEVKKMGLDPDKIPYRKPRNK